MLVYGECECFVMQMLYVCVLCASCGSSQCCVLHDLIRFFSSVFAITERRDIGLYDVQLSVSLLGFAIGTMLANFHV